MPETTFEVTAPKSENTELAVYEHPWPVRFCHWVNSIALLVLVGSGFQIFRAFPSFGAKIPQKDLLHWPKAFALGGWLGGGLQWHLTFMWIYIATGLFYFCYQLFSGNYRQVLFTAGDIRGVWPMVHYYFFFGPKPEPRHVYNPLQKFAYSSVLVFGVLSVLSGLAIWKPVQFSWLAWLMGGFHYARIWHFAVMWAILFFLLGHLIMVVLHGWNNFMSMLTGWKKNPEYVRALTMLSLSTAPSAIPPPQNQREAALIRRTLQGDRDAFTELVKPYERRVYAAALALLRNEADAEDIAQEAIVKAFTHLHQFRAEAKFSTWLIQITINQARMRQRKNHANLYDSLDDTHDGEEDYVPREFADWRETPPETLERKEIRALLAQALASLGEKYRSVFVLRDIEQLSIEETAKALAISVANVKTRLLRARLMLRDILAPALRDGWPGHVPFQKGEKPW